jgi:glycogenin glucosyltransferase
MWYDLPNVRPQPAQKPKAIFPWEERAEENVPSRVFAEDLPPPPVPASMQSGTTAVDSPSVQPQLDDDQFEPFAPQVNAWDNVASIERYVRAVMDAQIRRTKAQEAAHEILSPIPGGRRESLILTDFPTSDDRPSLPVTPAPIRRPTFWGDERDEAGELPAAEGVPDQAEWVCPKCGFFSASPVAFYRAPSASATAPTAAATATRRTSSTASTLRPQLRSRPESFDIPPLPAHLRAHRSSSGASALSTASTVAAETEERSTLDIKGSAPPAVTLAAVKIASA